MTNKEKLKMWYGQLNKIETYLLGTDRTKKEIESIEEACNVLGCFLEDQMCHSWLFDFDRNAEMLALIEK